MRMTNRVAFIVCIALATVTLAPSHADAYIGPGAGLSAIGSLFALLAAALIAVFGFIWYPIKRVIRMFRSKPKPQMRPETRRP